MMRYKGSNINKISYKMGRDLHWFIIQRDNIVHDDTKNLCFGWDFQPDESEVITEVVEKVGINESYNVLYKNDKNSDWCPKCHMFANGLFDSPLVEDRYHVGHCYTNPIWRSSWNVRQNLLGSFTTPFAILFRPGFMYREVVQEDINNAKFSMRMRGDPLRTSDKEARDETHEILDFLEPWTSHPDKYIVICRDEM